MKSRDDFETEAEYKDYLRKAFAMAAMQGLISQAQGSEDSRDKYTCNGGWVEPGVIAKNAISIADELLKQLES